MTTPDCVPRRNVKSLRNYAVYKDYFKKDAPKTSEGFRG
jgi:hypothetical protein